MKKFNSKKGNLYTGSLGLLFGTFLYSLISDKFSWPFSLFLLIPLCLLVWNYVTTYYILENGKLKYRSGMIKGEIDIATIKEIQPFKTSWVGLKPALAQNGIIIKYHKYDEIYISPENNDNFMEELIKINPSILVKS
jgi:MFS family permease